MALLLVLVADGLADSGVLPGGGQVQLLPAGELLLSLDEGVVDPLPVFEGDVGAEGACALVEGVDFFGRELAVEDFEVLAGLGGRDMRDLRLPVKRLLLRKSRFANSSLAP